MMTRHLSLMRSYHERVAGICRTQLIQPKVHIMSRMIFPLRLLILRGLLLSQGPAASSGTVVPELRPESPPC